MGSAWLEKDLWEPFSADSFAPLFVMALRTPPGFSLEHGFAEGLPGTYEPLGGEDDVPELAAEFDGETATILPTSTCGQDLPHVPGPTPQPQTVAIALATYGLSPLLGAALVRTLGCDEEDSAEALADLPDSELPNLTNELLIGDELRPRRSLKRVRFTPSSRSYGPRSHQYQQQRLLQRFE